ncbi:MAG: hypothetical protein V1933_04145 [Candidatus Omnitrophota bacterium]
MTQNKRKNKLTGIPLQRKLLFLIFASAVIPALMIGVCLYYLIFNMLAWQLGIPEAVAYNLLPVVRKLNLILLVALPITLFVIWIIALELSHRITGPLFRLEKELDDRISGKTHGHIKVRKRDEFRAIVDRINKLISAK